MKLLVDSDFLYGSFVETDPHYERSTMLFRTYKQEGAEFYVLGHVIQEVATVLSHRSGMPSVRAFIGKYPTLKLIEIHLDESLEKEAWNVFLRQTKNGCSFVDCANMAAIEKYKFDGILSFDEFYPKVGGIF